MKTMWMLLVVCVVACSGNDHRSVTDVTPEAVPTADACDVGTEVPSADAVTTSLDTHCIPNCEGKECGDDDCGGSCGSCYCGESCQQGGCVNISCSGKQCGPDGCGGSCGLCPCVECDPCATMCNEAEGICEGHCWPGCAEINECMAMCNPNDQACLQDCFDQGSPQGQQQLNDLMQCMIENGAQQCAPDDTECQSNIIMEHCMDEYGECYPGGFMTCSQMFECMADCPQDGQACFQGCFSDSTLEAQQQYQAIASCVIDQCGEDMSSDCVDAAQSDACADEYDACMSTGE